MTNIQQLENELWEAADQLRANSKLTAAEYAMPVLGLIFLRHADNRFKAFLPDIEADIPAKVPAKQREELIKLGFQGKAAIYLPEEARFDRIASLPEGAKVGEVIDGAMDRIEADYEVLAGALPRGYAAFEPELLAGLVKIFDRPAIRAATGDVFGRIYEYFLNRFAMTGAQEGGELFTPPSLVRTIVNFIEPDHGLVFDPACGSAGMFVQTGHFIAHVRHGAANDAVTFHGQEKSDREKIKAVARDLLQTLSDGKLQIDRWKEKATAQAQVKAEIIKHLFANLPDGVYDADEIDLKASAVFAHIFVSGSTTGARVYH